jgi:hypothetical protein
MHQDTGEIKRFDSRAEAEAAGFTIPVARDEPDPRCKKCWGRGWIGTCAVTGKKVPCRCVLPKRSAAFA